MWEAVAKEMKIPAWFGTETAPPARGEAQTEGFVEKNLGAVAGFMKEVLESHEYSRRKGMLQAIEARARTGGILILVVSAAFMEKTLSLLAMVLVAAAIMRLSQVDGASLLKRVLPPALFTGILVIPAFFSFVTPGSEIVGFTVAGSRIAMTVEGVEVGLRLLVRVSVMVSFVALLFLTTKEADLFRGLKGIPVPGFFITALFMTFRYILILLKMVEDSNLSRKSRTIRRTALKGSQGWFAGRVAFLFQRSINISEEVTLAMASRGFKGRVRTLEDKTLSGRDYLWLGFASFVFFIALGV
jgi:cobalt ECF transporter T component CbiQ